MALLKPNHLCFPMSSSAKHKTQNQTTTTTTSTRPLQQSGPTHGRRLPDRPVQSDEPEAAQSGDGAGNGVRDEPAALRDVEQLLGPAGPRCTATEQEQAQPGQSALQISSLKQNLYHTTYHTTMGALTHTHTPTLTYIRSSSNNSRHSDYTFFKQDTRLSYLFAVSCF